MLQNRSHYTYMSPIRQQKVDNMSNIKGNNVEILVQILNQYIQIPKEQICYTACRTTKDL